LYSSSSNIKDKRNFLNELKEIKNKKYEIFEPTIKAGNGGGFQYKELANKLQSFDEQLEYLKILEEIELVKSKEGIPIIICSHCKKFNFSIRFICNYCKSMDIKSGRAIEHDLCHNIDFEENYLTEDNSLKCTKCYKILKAIGLDYSKINIFKCQICNGISVDAEQQYICINCGTTNSKTDLLTSNLFEYTINDSKLINLINDLEYLLPIVEELDRLGIKSDYQSTIKGISGTSHSFDLIAFNNNNEPILLLETIETSNEHIFGNKENLILSFIGKCSDFNIQNKILVVFDELPFHLLNLLKSNKITVLKMNNREESSIEIAQLITELFNNTIEQEEIIKNEK
jgi:hypothetical protein